MIVLGRFKFITKLEEYLWKINQFLKNWDVWADTVAQCL